MRTYRGLLGLPHVAPLLAANVLARLDLGMSTLALLLFLRARTGSFAVAGGVAAAYGLGIGVVAPFMGRRVDRRGVGTLGRLAALHATGLLALLFLGRAGAPASVLLLAGALTGASVPPTGSVLRVLWPQLTRTRPELLTTAFALDAVLIELIFTTGPLIVALIVVLASAEMALAVSAVTVLAGTWTFLALIPEREREAVDAERPEPARFGALASPGIRTLVLVMVPVGCAFGLMEVALPALARADGAPELAGVLLAVWSASSAMGGIAWGARERRIPLVRAHARFGAFLPLGFVPVLLAPSAPLAVLLIVPAGIAIAPLIATRNELAGAVAPAGVATEAFTWPTTALVTGLALGNAVAGGLADGPGWRAAVVVAIGAAALGAALTAMRRTTLVSS